MDTAPHTAAAIDAATAVGPVALTVRDRARVAAWYRDVLGMVPLAEDGRAVVLGAADGTPLVTLVGAPDAPLAGRRAPGLYHVAILLPARADLGRWLRHTAAVGARLQGASDHLVSEATYLADPEGNGIEVYRDRPRAEWPRRDGRIHMDNSPFDIAGVLADGDAVGRRFDGLPAGTVVGHVHLKVADVAATRRFYVDTLGFEATEEGYPSALFVAAGGYHHHFGLNAWESAGGTRVAGATGLRHATVTMAPAARAAHAARLAAAGLGADAGPATAAVDPSGNRLLFVDRPIDAATALALADA
ncbi:VOC family protein [Oharaeibacter diazotrophicus]|uniref:Catechol 2,3-dioxygenase n=2 Tax=Oharaeibacter diazotrophicus TaxID=1920512 RepID=A0A4R6R7B3_9HYPH|nr:VOC family protein [Oharaeibacter diazotrophicus]TDP81447.1 catechol 2,3-dioxygenase [Oharaeibacter diazotrophicus]BBE73685.1 catechol-2,3-dioxygenase [Pleomorphomonas sp. SM30]GLS75474.1 glyoxalase [Oharaeibacter diazotrophicus]